MTDECYSPNCPAASLDERLRGVETLVAVNKVVLDRIELDLREIAASSEAIKDVVTRWKGGLGVMLLIGGGTVAVIAAIIDLLLRKVWP